MNKKSGFNLFSSKNEFKQSFTIKIPPQNPIISDENKENMSTLQQEKIENFQEKSDIFQKKRLSALDKLKKSFSSNLYQILQISPNSDPIEIKKAFKRLSLKLHPDKNRTGNKEEFQNVLYAYKILGNPEVRKIYDEQGSEVADMILNMYEGNCQNLTQEF